MKTSMLFLLGGICGAALATLPRTALQLHAAMHSTQDSQPASPRAHVESKFEFTAHAPIHRVWPLFGAEKERVWSPAWNPQFIYPHPAADVPGMVFTVAHDHLRATWVNTDLDPKSGRVQYAYVIPDALVTVITLQMKSAGTQTQVEVRYDRTALNPEADDHVRQLAKQDRQAGPDWEKQINQYLEK